MKKLISTERLKNKERIYKTEERRRRQREFSGNDRRKKILENPPSDKEHQQPGQIRKRLEENIESNDDNKATPWQHQLPKTAETLPNNNLKSSKIIRNFKNFDHP